MTESFRAALLNHRARVVLADGLGCAALFALALLALHLPASG